MFHRFRIGAMDATIVSDGPLVLPRAARIFKGPDEAAMDTALGASGQATDKVRVEQNCLLLDTGGKRVLFDNGMGSSKLFGPDSGQLLDSLAEAGVDPASIDALVLTHAHSDHCWGTMRDDGVPNYPNATIYMAQAELAFWESNPPGERRERSLAGVRKHLLPLRDRIQLIRDGEEIPARRDGLGNAGTHARPHGVSVRRRLVPDRRRGIPRSAVLRVPRSRERVRYRPGRSGGDTAPVAGTAGGRKAGGDRLSPSVARAWATSNAPAARSGLSGHRTGSTP